MQMHSKGMRSRTGPPHRSTPEAADTPVRRDSIARLWHHTSAIPAAASCIPPPVGAVKTVRPALASVPASALLLRSRTGPCGRGALKSSTRRRVTSSCSEPTPLRICWRCSSIAATDQPSALALGWALGVGLLTVCRWQPCHGAVNQMECARHAAQLSPPAPLPPRQTTR